MKPLHIESRGLYRSLALALFIDACFMAFIYFLEAFQLATNKIPNFHSFHPAINWPIFCGIQVLILLGFAWWRKKHSLFHGTLMYFMVRLTWTLSLAILLWLNS